MSLFKNKGDVVVINFIGSPGSGKSTAAHGVVYFLKMMGKRCEMAQEYAKDLVFDENYRTLARQEYVFAEQHARLQRLNKSEFIVTDSPLILSLLYGEHYPDSFKEYVRYVTRLYDSKYYLVKRNHPYDEFGRHQTEDESDEMYQKIKDMLDRYDVEYTELKSTEAVDFVLNELKHKGLI